MIVRYKNLFIYFILSISKLHLLYKPANKSLKNPYKIDNPDKHICRPGSVPDRTGPHVKLSTYI